MNLRHAAALALVGWYLMVPPPIGRQDWNRHTPSPPLNRWILRDSFDSADACRNARTALQDRYGKENSADYDRWLAGRASSDELMNEWAGEYNPLLAIRQAESLAECIASDDPRLKEK